MKTKLFLAAMAAVAVIGCQKETGAPVHEADGTASFMKVDLRAAGTMTKAPGNFEFGSEVENNVSTVTFYFFDASGNKYVVQNAENYMHGDIGDNWSDGTEENLNVEKISGLILVIKQAQDGQIPSRMVTVLNAPESMQHSYNTLSELSTDVLENVKEGADFIMSTSVYVDGGVVNYTEITADNLYVANHAVGEPGYNKPGTIITPEDEGYSEGDADAVEIYVERVAAKVKLANTSMYFPVYAEDGETQLTASDGTTPVYMRIDGWDVTNVTSQSTALKQLSATYTGIFDPWNVTAFHRSYWANTTAPSLHTLKYNDLITADAKKAEKYYHENTNEYSNGGNGVDVDAENNVNDNTTANQAPQLIIAGTLVNGNTDAATAISLAKWYDTYYTEEGVKAKMIASVDHRVYVKESNGDLIPVTSTDVEFAQNPQTEEEEGRYWVYATEKEGVNYYDATGKQINSGTAGVAENETAEHIFRAIDPAQIWKDGRTYYYTDIQHFGYDNNPETQNVGEYGLVRNHCYVIEIDAVKGFGTPVYEPGDVITPERPEDLDAVNLSARINILAWHLVSQNVTLN